MASRYPFSSLGFGSDADPFALLHDRMDRLFDQTLHRLGVPPAVGAGSTPAMTGPRMDVTETERELRIELDVPGVPREDLELSLDGDMLTIRGQRQPVKHEDGKQPTVHLVERAHGRFERTLQLPFSAEMDQCNASLQNGVLTITLAKADTQRKARRIEIRGPQDAAGQQRTQLAHGETEVLDAEKPAGGTTQGSDAHAQHGSAHPQSQQGEQRVH